MPDYTSMTDSDLMYELDRLWRVQMYHMAAEGNYGQEKDDRDAVKKMYEMCEKEYLSRGLVH